MHTWSLDLSHHTVVISLLCSVDYQIDISVGYKCIKLIAVGR